MHAMIRGGEGENMILKKVNVVLKLIISKPSLLPKYVNTYKEILYNSSLWNNTFGLVSCI